MGIKRKLRKALVTASPETSAHALAVLMRSRHVGAVVITEKDRPVGIVTDRDLVSRVMARQDDPRTVRARDIMSSDLVVVREDTPLARVTAEMRAQGIRRVPVVDARGRLVSIQTLDDMLVVLGEEIANLGRAVVAGIGREARLVARGRAGRLRSEEMATARPG